MRFGSIRRSSVAIPQGRWIRRLRARGIAIGVALVAHGAVLFALTYNPVDKRVFNERPAAISVELAMVPPNGSPRAIPDDDASSETASATMPDPDQQELAGNISPETAEHDEVVATDRPVVLPAPRRHPVAVAKVEPGPTPPIRRAALSLVPDTRTQRSDAADGGTVPVAGTNVASTDIPST